MIRGEQPATDEFLIWQAHRVTPEGKRYDRSAALKAIVAALPLAA